MEHVSDCERLAKQCQLWDLLDDLEAKCEKVSEFGAYRVSVQSLQLQPATPVQLSKSPLSSSPSGFQAWHVREGADY